MSGCTQLFSLAPWFQFLSSIFLVFGPTFQTQFVLFNSHALVVNEVANIAVNGIQLNGEWLLWWFVAMSCPTLAIPCTVACQAPLSMGFSRQEY